MRRRLFAVAAVVAATVAGVMPAVAQVAQPAVVAADPVDWTPHVLDGTVHAIAVVGDTVVVGGTFSAVEGGGFQYRRDYLLAFGAADGAIRGFAPRLDGPVYALAAGPDGTVYAGGAFRTVNGVAQRGLTRLTLANGARVAGFDPSINWGDVRALAASGRWVYAGGTFSAVNRTPRAGLARLDAGSGAVDAGFDAGLTGATAEQRVRVEDFALAPGGRRLVVAGAFARAAGQPRVQLALLDTGGPRAVAVDWYTDAYQDTCDAGYDTYLRGIDFAPDASYFVVVTTGNASGATRPCDTAARFNVAGAGRHAPVWINHTGGNTLLSVAVTGSAVYVGGHQQWLDNPQGDKSAGPGAVSRPGIGAIDPRTGKALAWNPTRSRGVGVRAFLATASGLWVGSDTDRLGNEYHGRIGMFPL